MILYGLLAEQSARGLFLAGLMPGLFALGTSFRAHLSPGFIGHDLSADRAPMPAAEVLAIILLYVLVVILLA